MSMSSGKQAIRRAKMRIWVQPQSSAVLYKSIPMFQKALVMALNADNLFALLYWDDVLDIVALELGGRGHFQKYYPVS